MGHCSRLIREPMGQPMRDWVNSIPHSGLIRYLDFFNTERVAVVGSKALADILVHKPYDFVKPPTFARVVGSVVGIGLFLAEGDEHKVCYDTSRLAQHRLTLMVRGNARPSCQLSPTETSEISFPLSGPNRKSWPTASPSMLKPRKMGMLISTTGLVGRRLTLLAWPLSVTITKQYRILPAYLPKIIVRCCLQTAGRSLPPS